MTRRRNRGRGGSGGLVAVAAGRAGPPGVAVVADIGSSLMARPAAVRRARRNGTPECNQMAARCGSEYAGGMEQPTTSLPAGLTARVELTVTDGDTAQAMGSGDVPVLGTPRLLALAEAATVAATAAKLPPGTTTVGTRVELDHTAPSPVGAKVTALATLAKVDGRRLLFEVRVTAGDQPIAEARIERALVDRQRFVSEAFGQ